MSNFSINPEKFVQLSAVAGFIGSILFVIGNNLNLHILKCIGIILAVPVCCISLPAIFIGILYFGIYERIRDRKKK